MRYYLCTRETENPWEIWVLASLSKAPLRKRYLFEKSLCIICMQRHVLLLFTHWRPYSITVSGVIGQLNTSRERFRPWKFVTSSDAALTAGSGETLFSTTTDSPLINISVALSQWGKFECPRVDVTCVENRSIKRKYDLKFRRRVSSDIESSRTDFNWRDTLIKEIVEAEIWYNTVEDARVYFARDSANVANCVSALPGKYILSQCRGTWN